MCHDNTGGEFSEGLGLLTQAMPERRAANAMMAGSHPRNTATIRRKSYFWMGGNQTKRQDASISVGGEGEGLRPAEVVPALHGIASPARKQRARNGNTVAKRFSEIVLFRSDD